MGAWGTGLYSDDVTLDFNDEYIKELKLSQAHDLAYKALYKNFKRDYGESNPADEVLLWFVIAERQWYYGDLLPEVKAKALEFLDREEHLELWRESESIKSLPKRIKALNELRMKLSSPVPPKRALPQIYIFPHEIGDIFAVKITKFTGPWYYGDYNKYIEEYKNKYFIFQIVGKEENDCNIYPMIQRFFWCDYDLPDLDQIKKLPLMASPDDLKNNLGNDAEKVLLFCSSGTVKRYIKLRHIDCEDRNIPRYDSKGNLWHFGGLSVSSSILEQDFYARHRQLKEMGFTK